jgi:hypothetical protein
MPGGKFPSLLNVGIISTQQYRCVDYSSSSGAQLLSKQPDRLGNRAADAISGRIFQIQNAKAQNPPEGAGSYDGAVMTAQ